MAPVRFDFQTPAQTTPDVKIVAASENEQGMNGGEADSGQATLMQVDRSVTYNGFKIGVVPASTKDFLPDPRTRRSVQRPGQSSPPNHPVHPRMRI